MLPTPLFNSSNPFYLRTKGFLFSTFCISTPPHYFGANPRHHSISQNDTFSCTFFEVTLIEHLINHFKKPLLVNNSEEFSAFSMWRSHHYPLPDIVIILDKTLYPRNSPPRCPSAGQRRPPICCSVDLQACPFGVLHALESLWKRLPFCVWLFSLTLVFSRSGWGWGRVASLIHFCGGIILHCADTPAGYLLIHREAFGWFPPFGCCDESYREYSCTSICLST